MGREYQKNVLRWILKRIEKKIENVPCGPAIMKQLGTRHIEFRAIFWLKKKNQGYFQPLTDPKAKIPLILSF